MPGESPAIAAKSTVDCFTGGSLLPGRNYSSSTYNYGFNGMRKDDEIHGATGTSYDFGARIYDPRVGRWLSLDPLGSQFPSLSPFAFAANNPILYVDVNGEYFFIRSRANQTKVTAALAVLFNGSDAAFTYRKNRLVIDPSKIHGTLSPEQQFALRKIQDIAVDENLRVNVRSVKKGGNYTTPLARDSRGELTKATILINPDHPLVEEKMKDTESGFLYPGSEEEVSGFEMDGTLNYSSPNESMPSFIRLFANILGHEIGHISEDRSGNRMGTEANAKKTVGFENKIRSILGMNPRMGETHGDDDGDPANGNEHKGVEDPTP